ncbi:MAG: AMP-binding protein [Planctomycetota bacterium]
MTDYIWHPTRDGIEHANITRLLRLAGERVDPDNGEEVARQTRAFVRRTQDDPEWFWRLALADMRLDWYQPFDRVLDLRLGVEWADWFVGGKTNIALNCVDRHARSAHAGHTALIAETEDGEVRRYTFGELASHVGRTANALRALGVGSQDTVACYMPMIAEVVFAMLATQKIGAIFVPIFSGYAPAAVRERLADAEVKVLFTADGSLRRGQPFSIKQPADSAVEGLPHVRGLIVVRRIGEQLACPMRRGRDYFWHEFVASQPGECATEQLPALTPSLMIYTSGTTGKPKGTVHTHAGCLAQMGKELCYNFDVKPGERFWWFSDIGWMMGPWEIIGCLQHGTGIVIYEGAPNTPQPDRVWSLVEKHEVSHLGISPTAVRLLRRSGDEWADRHPMPSLRILGSTGEPWDPESYLWYFEHVGKRRVPVINISGGTDIVGCFLAPLPVMPLKPATLQAPGLGMAVDVFNEAGESVVDQVGYLVCTKPAPSMTRGLWKNREKYLETYWSRFPGVWNHGDWAKVDTDGDWFLYGRADDTLKVAGRRVGPGEIEAALMEHELVAEAAAIGVPDELKGTDIVCFVVLKRRDAESEQVRIELSEKVVAALGKVDRPKAVLFADDLPKTRSAKIVRRLIQRRYLGAEDLGDLSSVANPEALNAVAAAR